MNNSPRSKRGIAARIAAVTGIAVAISLTGLPATAADPLTVVSLTFDDSTADQWTAVETLNAVNLDGTFFVVSGYVDAPGYLTRAQLNAMSAAGHEIGGHTVTHPDLATISAAEAARQVCLDRATLTSWGFNVRSFAYPYASINDQAEQAVSDCGYTSGRGLGDLESRFGCPGCDVAETLPPANPYYTKAADQVDSSWTLTDLQDFILNAEAQGGWVQLTFHHVCDNCDSLSISPGLLAQFTEWLAARTLTHNLAVKTVGDAIGQPVRPVVGAPMTPAAGHGENGVVNPSLETAGNGTPYCWMRGGYGSNSASFDLVSPGRSGAVAHRLVVSGYVDGDAKLLPVFDLGECSPTVNSGESYSLRSWYRSTAPTQFAVYLRNSSGSWSYWTSSPWFPSSPVYREAAWQSPAVPSGYTAMSFGLNLFQNGELITDDYALYNAAGAPDPLLDLTPAWPWITGVEKVGGTLTANSIDWGPDEVTVDYQWLRDGAPIDGAVDTTYSLTADDLGAMVTVRATGGKTGYNPSTTISVAVGPVVEGDLEPTTPSISGTPRVGLTLNAVTDAWGPAPVTLSYQWLRDGLPVSGANSSDYALTADDEGATISVTVTGTKEGYGTAWRTSASSSTVAEGELVPATPSISGSPKVGETLTVVPGTWTPDATALTFQWLRNGSPIPGASGPTYTARLEDSGAVVAVRVTGTSPGYADMTITSIAVGPVGAGDLQPATPTLTGLAKVGSTLTVDPGAWGPGPVTLSYQWLRAGAPVDGATSASYTLVAADMGAQIRVVVTGARDGYSSTSRTSAPSDPVAAGTLSSGAAVIGGVAVVGSVLTVNTQGWGPGAVNLSIQWYRSGAKVNGATSSSYLLTAADVGATISAVVSGSKAGYASITLTTPLSAIVSAAELTPGVPSLTGSAQVGKTLTVLPGTWPPGTGLSYQWFRSGVSVPGAIGLSYTPAAADVGAVITAAVSGAKAGYSTVTVTTAATAAVVEGVLTPGTPTISGIARVGNTLTVSAGDWTPGTVALSYQWLRAGAEISGATATSYTLVAADEGGLISVAVTGAQDGYETATVRPPGLGVLVEAAETTVPQPTPPTNEPDNPTVQPRPSGGLAGFLAGVALLLFGWLYFAWRRRF